MVNSRFAVWLGRNSGTEKEKCTPALSGEFVKSDDHPLLFPLHVGFKFLHFNLLPQLSSQNGKKQKVGSKSKHWKYMLLESLTVI